MIKSPADLADLIKRLQIKADTISMGERIAWGSDSAIMHEAAEALLEMYQYGRQDAVSRIEKWVAQNSYTKDTAISDFPDQHVYEVDANKLLDELQTLKNK